MLCHYSNNFKKILMHHLIPHMWNAWREFKTSLTKQFMFIRCYSIQWHLSQTVQNVYYIWGRYMNWGQKEIIRDVEIESARVFFTWIYPSLRNRHMQHTQTPFKMALIQLNCPQCSITCIIQILRIVQDFCFFNFSVILK